MKNKYSEPNAGAQRRLFNERLHISKILKHKNLDSKSEIFLAEYLFLYFLVFVYYTIEYNESEKNEHPK
jgi:hypothetical protein